MSTPADGGPAFPATLMPDTPVQIDHDTGRLERLDSPGMSLRDWFAGQALNGMLVHAAQGNSAEFAHQAYRLADAMLAAREPRPGRVDHE